MSEFTGKKLKEARVKKGLSQDEAANLMNVAKRAISEMEAGKRSISADELAQFSRIYNVDVRELLFVEFTEAGDEQRLTAKYSSFLKLLEKLSDREVEDVYWVIKRKVEGYMTIKETAEKWGTTPRRVQVFCLNGRIEGAGKLGREWAIPIDAEKSKDERVKTGKYINRRNK
jgi:transcriptional regulator with XRE-family HTH domain